MFSENELKQMVCLRKLQWDVCSDGFQVVLQDIQYKWSTTNSKDGAYWIQCASLVQNNSSYMVWADKSLSRKLSYKVLAVIFLMLAQAFTSATCL